MRDFIHPRIISELEFKEFMSDKFETKTLKEHNDEFIDLIYVLLDKRDCPKTFNHHHLNLKCLINLNLFINNILELEDINDIYCRIIYNILTQKILEEYTDLISFRDYSKLKEVGFKTSINPMKEYIAYDEFKSTMEKDIALWKIV